MRFLNCISSISDNNNNNNSTATTTTTIIIIFTGTEQLTRTGPTHTHIHTHTVVKCWGRWNGPEQVSACRPRVHHGRVMTSGALVAAWGGGGGGEGGGGEGGGGGGGGEYKIGSQQGAECDFVVEWSSHVLNC